MNINDILTLGRMGYTKADIEKMTNDPAAEPAKTAEPASAPAKTAEPASEPAPAKTAEPAPAPAPTKAAEPPKADGTELDRLFGKLSELTAALQASNRAAADMGANIIDPRAMGVNALAGLSGYTTNSKED